MLRGSLSDLNLVELIQIPASGRKTGELLIATVEHDARLYYVDGRLAHLVMDELEGQAVLDRVIDWSDGEFEFRPDVMTDGSSFEGDLHKAIMVALKTRDETSSPSASARQPDQRVVELLREFVDANSFAMTASIVHSDPSLEVCVCRHDPPPEWLAPMRDTLWSVVSSYPRGQLGRALLEDDLGLAVMSTLGDGSALLVTANRSLPIGAVSVAVERLVRKLCEGSGRRGSTQGTPPPTSSGTA